MWQRNNKAIPLSENVKANDLRKEKNHVLNVDKIYSKNASSINVIVYKEK
jgi:hypothetical protein